MGLELNNVHIFQGDYTLLSLDNPPNIVQDMLNKDRGGAFV